MILGAQATDAHGQICIKIETNISETTPFKTLTAIDHTVALRWWNGAAPVPTFVLDEMMSTKLRALYQRRKGRDLFDLWLGPERRPSAATEIVGGLEHCMQRNAFTYSSWLSCRRWSGVRLRSRRAVRSTSVAVPASLSVLQPGAAATQCTPTPAALCA